MKIFAEQLFDGEVLHSNVLLNVSENGVIDEINYNAAISSEHKFYEGIIAPAFINAHCHIELSHLKNEIEEGKGLVDFLLNVVQKRTSDEVSLQLAMQNAMDEMWKNGIVFVGDISNHLYSISIKQNHTLQTHTFVEVIGFNPENYTQHYSQSENVLQLYKLAGLSTSFALHAPYSVSVPLLTKVLDSSENLISIHHQESEAENDFFRNGKSDFNRLYHRLSIPIDYHVAYNKSSLQHWSDKLFSFKENIILVHNTFIDEQDLQSIKNKTNIYLCTCPNANMYIENTLPDYTLWMKNNMQICIGTDSLASNHSLCILDEMKTIKRQFPQIDFIELLRWATYNGAKALKISDNFGKISVGRAAKIVHLKQAPKSLNGKCDETYIEKLY